jgi:hypothetical protein
MPRGVISEDTAIPATVPSPQLSTIQAPPPSVPSVDSSNEKASKVSAEDLDRLVKVWENKVGRRSRTGNKVRFVVLRLLALGLVVLSAGSGLSAWSLFSRGNSFSNGNWQVGLVQAFLALLFGWAARRCWRLAGTS